MGMTFIEKYEVTGAAEQDLTFAATLDGDSDVRYVVSGTIINGAAPTSVTYEWYPNGADPGTDAVTAGQSGGTGFTVNDEMHIVADGSANIIIDARIYGASGEARGFSQEVVGVSDDLGTASSHVTSTCIWGSTETGDNLTSISIHSDNANGFGVGTVLRLWKTTE